MSQNLPQIKTEPASVKIMKIRQQQILKSLTDYQEGIDEELFFKAYVELGEIYNVINHYDFKDNLNEIYLNKITTYSSDLESQIIVEEDFEVRLNQLLHILSGEDVFSEEEILLILTMRFELSLVNSILLLHNKEMGEYNSEGIDEKIKSIKNNKKNTKSFNTALKLMYKNWEVAMFDSPWLTP